MATWHMPYDYDVYAASIKPTSDAFISAKTIMNDRNLTYLMSNDSTHKDIASRVIVPGDLLCEKGHVTIVDKVAYNVTSNKREIDTTRTFVIEATPGSLLLDWKVLNKRSWKNLDDLPVAQFFPRRLK